MDPTDVRGERPVPDFHIASAIYQTGPAARQTACIHMEVWNGRAWENFTDENLRYPLCSSS